MDWQTDVDSMILDYLWFVFMILRKRDQQWEFAFCNHPTLILKEDYTVKKDILISLLIRTLFTSEPEYYEYSVSLSFKGFIGFLNFYFLMSRLLD